MAAITSAQSGLASDPLTWVGGVVPGATDTVTIAAGHVVTLDGNYEWGNDSLTGIVINGTLKASRLVSSQLTCFAHAQVVASSGGFYDAGTAADPIPAGVNHTLVLNKSAAMVRGKYGLHIASGGASQGRLSMHGKYRKRNARLLSGALAVGATACTVDDATGWEVGDQVLFAVTANSVAALDVRTILTLTPGAGTTADITFAALTYAHSAAARVGNFSSNVKVTPYNIVTGSSYVYVQHQPTTGTFEDYCHLHNVYFEGGGGAATDSATKYGLLTLYAATGNTYILPVVGPITNCAFYSKDAPSSLTSAIVSCMNYKQRYYFNGCAFAAIQNSGLSPIHEYGGSVENFDDTVIYAAGNQAIASGYSQGGCDCVHTNMDFFGGAAYSGNSFTPVFRNCRVGCQSSAPFAISNVARGLVEDCDIGVALGVNSATRLLSWTQGNAVGDFEFKNCLIHNNLITRPTNLWMTQPSSLLKITNKNLDVTLHEWHYPAGSFYRDNALSYRGGSSIRLETENNAQMPYTALLEIPVAASTGVPVKVIGYLRKNAAYGALTLPAVTVSGLGITPQTFTMTDSTNVWERFEFDVTQTSGAFGYLKLAFTGRSANAGAMCYLDGVAFAPFVGRTDHYGYTYDPANNVRTVDTVITNTDEAAVATYTGVAIAGGVITVSEAVSKQELYDYCQLYRVQNHVGQFFTSTDGTNFACVYDLTITATGAITGVGAISMPDNTLTVIAGGKSDLPITHNAGVLVPLSVSGYNAGARIQVYDETSLVELYNDIPASGTLALNTNWTTNHTIRCRMARVSGVDADKLIETRSLLTSAGASFLLTPTADTVYEYNAIDGSAVTEFTADFPNVQIDISDPDGVTSPQRCYAWYVALQMTAPGLAYYHGAITAEDDSNYRVNVSVADMRAQNVGVNPVVVSGARMYRSDGQSIFAVGVGPIQAEPGRAFVADDIRREVQSALTIVSGL